MSKVNIEIEITSNDTELYNDWKITFGGEGWSEKENVEGIFDGDGNTIITTEDIFDEKRRLIYSLMSYALGDI